MDNILGALMTVLVLVILFRRQIKSALSEPDDRDRHHADEKLAEIIEREKARNYDESSEAR